MPVTSRLRVKVNSGQPVTPGPDIRRMALYEQGQQEDPDTPSSPFEVLIGRLFARDAADAQ